MPAQKHWQWDASARQWYRDDLRGGVRVYEDGRKVRLGEPNSGGGQAGINEGLNGMRIQPSSTTTQRVNMDDARRSASSTQRLAGAASAGAAERQPDASQRKATELQRLSELYSKSKSQGKREDKLRPMLEKYFEIAQPYLTKAQAEAVIHRQLNSAREASKADGESDEESDAGSNDSQTDGESDDPRRCATTTTRSQQPGRTQNTASLTRTARTDPIGAPTTSHQQPRQRAPNQQVGPAAPSAISTTDTSREAQEGRTWRLYFELLADEEGSEKAALRTARAVRSQHSDWSTSKLASCLLTVLPAAAARELLKSSSWASVERLQRSSADVDSDDESDAEALRPIWPRTSQRKALLPITYAKFSDDESASSMLANHVLLDSGATHNLISVQMISSLRASRRVKEMPRELVGYTGLSSTIQGQIALTCRFPDGYTITESFRVTPAIPVDAIVCYSTLEEHKLLSRELPYHSVGCGVQVHSTIMGWNLSGDAKKQQHEKRQDKRLENNVASNARSDKNAQELAARMAPSAGQENSASSTARQRARPSQQR